MDLRQTSPTFGKHVSVVLSDKNKKQFFIPRGFAHGFLVLSNEAIFTYKVDNIYKPDSESTILYSDDFLKIDWSENLLILSEKDKHAKSFNEAEYYI